MYRIKYWYQETVESGRWCLTGTMPLHAAEEIVDSGAYESASISPDPEYAICKNCAHRDDEECEENRGYEIYPDDTCPKWVDAQA